jgi:hypothetical protein
MLVSTCGSGIQSAVSRAFRQKRTLNPQPAASEKNVSDCASSPRHRQHESTLAKTAAYNLIHELTPTNDSGQPRERD